MKKALLVGINYPGTNHALRGCVNDVKMMRTLLSEAPYEFTQIHMITDNDATTKNIMDGLNLLVKDAKAGDVLFFHYSGHGSQLPDYSNEILEKDGLDEVLIPVDIDWRTKIIKDDDLKRIFDKVPNGTNLTVVIDACHSGSGLDQKNRFKPLGQGVAREVPEREVARFLPPPPDAFEYALKKQKMRNLTRSFVKQRDVNRAGLLVSGCQSHQTSADAYIGNEYCGACTKNLFNILRQKKGEITYKALVNELNNRLVRQGYTQRPELNGSGALFTSKFMMSAEKADEVVSTNETPKPKPICRRCKKVRRNCRCPRRWKMYWWRRNGPWRIYYKRLVRRWKARMAKIRR